MKKLLAWFFFSSAAILSAQSLEDTLKQAASGPSALTQAMEPWLDVEGFDRLREALKVAKPKSAADWHAVALLEERLLRDEEALAAWKAACGMKSDVSEAMRLGVMRALARGRQFADALKEVEALDDATLSLETAHDLLWLLIGISREQDFRSAAMARLRKLAAARPADVEVQKAFIWQERQINGSGAVRRRIREGLENDSAPELRTLWQLFELKDERDQGHRDELVTKAMSLLERLAADEVTERAVVDHLRETFQNGRDDPKFKRRPQEVAAKFPSRAVIVRAMAEMLRESGETAEAVKLLGTLPADEPAKRLLLAWAAEDDREAELPPVVLPQVSEVKGALDLPPEAAWKAELEALTDAGARFTRLLALRREFPADAEVAMAWIEAWSGRQRHAEALQEALWVHQRLAQDEKQRRAWWERLGTNQTVSWVIITHAQALPWLRDDPAFEQSWQTRNGQQRAADRIASPLWREAFESLTRGMPRLASRVMLEQAGEAELDAELAGSLAIGLMASREWKDAAVFLGLQRVRFPQDYRLAYLHGLALKGGGDAAGAEAVFLKMGSFTQEIRRRVTGQESYYSRGMRILLPEAVLETWDIVSRAVLASAQADEMLSRWAQEVAYARSLDQMMFSPPAVKVAGAWGLAQLLQLASKRDAAARTALAERARAAGLPVPELLEAGKVTRRVEYGTELSLDENWLRQHLELDWAAQVLLRQIQMRTHLPGRTAEQKAADATVARESAAAMLVKKPSTALQAAALAWQLQPETEMPAEVPAALEKAEGVDANLLSPALATLPLEARRKAAGALMPLVMALAGKEGVSADQKASWVTCALWLGAWKEAAALAADYQSPVRPMQDASPAWAMMQGTSPLQWPPQAAPWFYGFPPSGAPWLPEGEKAVFLAAAQEIKNPGLRLAWLHTGGDAAGAEKAVRSWIKAEPDLLPATLAAASLLAHEKKADEALDLLHAWAQRQKDADQRRLGLRLYLQAAFYPSSGQFFSSMNEAGRPAMPPPPPKHAKRLQQAARELLPEVRHLAGAWAGAWHPIFRALDLREGEATPRLDRYQQGIWQGDKQARTEQAETWRDRQERQPVSSYTVKKLLEAGKKAPALELTLRQLRRDADQRFRGSMERQNVGQIEEWRQVIASGAMAAELVKAATPQKADDTHRLAQAAHVAEVCADWPQVVTWAEAALKLDPAWPAMRLALADARQRLSGDPAVLVAALRAMPPAEARGSLQSLLQQAQQTADFTQRLSVAQAAITILSETPEVLSPEIRKGEMNVGLNLQSEILRSLFELLTQAVANRQNQRVAPPLYPGWSYSRGHLQGVSEAAVEAPVLERRKALHEQLCEMALKHPEWAEITLRPLTARHLVDGRPSQEDLHAYARKAMAALPQRSPAILQAWTSQGAPADASLRYRLAGLVLPLLGEAWKGREKDSWGQSGLVEIIGGQIPPPGEHHHALHALWEWPEDIATGKPVYTPDQLALNKQRRELMDQLWKSVQNIPALKREVFPAWASYRLHFIDSPQEVIEAAKGTEEPRGGQSVLQSFLQFASQSYSNQHHILTAEVMEALLRQEQLKNTPRQSSSEAEMLDRTIRLVLEGRTGQSQSMPALTVTTDEAERVLGKGWQKRRLDVLARFEELFGGPAAALPPELLFIKLQEALLADKDTSQIEAALRRQLESNVGGYESGLNSFITAANGGKVFIEGGYSEGVWELKRRLAWFETALRLGEPLLKGTAENPNGREEWLRNWISALMMGNDTASPPIPKAFMIASYDSFNTEQQRAYFSDPATRKRDDLLLRGMERAIILESIWSRYGGHFIELQLTRGEAGRRSLDELLRRLAKTRPGQILDGFLYNDTIPWLPLPDGTGQLDCAELILAALKLVPTFPEVWNYEDMFSKWRRTVLSEESSYGRDEIPMLPDKPWLSLSGRKRDFELRQPMARERLAAWRRILDHAATVPSLAGMALRDLTRLHVEDDPDGLIKIASILSDRQWFRFEERFASTFIGGDEAHAPAARRAAWGHFFLLWEVEAAKRLKRSPENASHRHWPNHVLAYLRSEGRSNLYNKYQPPPSSKEDHDRLAETARQYAALLESDPTGTPEGFSLFARRQFRPGQPPDSVLKLIRESLVKKPEIVSSQVRKWFEDTGSSLQASTAECAWAGGMAVVLAREWPADSPALTWSGSAARMLRQASRRAGERKKELLDLLESLLGTLLRSSRACGEATGVYAVEASKEADRSQRLIILLLELAARDPKTAAQVMHGWLPSPPYREDWASRSLPARLAVQVLQKWPEKAPPETLAWANGLAHYLSTGISSPDNMGFGTTERSSNGQRPPFWFWPTPGATPEDRNMQRDVLAFSSRMVTDDLSWRLPLALRLAVQSETADADRVKVLKPFFEPDKREASLTALQELLGPAIPPDMPTSMYMGGIYMRPDTPVLPDRRAAAVRDAATCLQIAIREKWLSAMEAASLEENARARLQSTIQQAEKRTAEVKQTRIPVPVAGPLESQAQEARKLLESWLSLDSPAGDEPLAPALISSSVTQALKQGIEVKVIASRVMKAVSAAPEPAAQALAKWAALQNHSFKLKEWLKLGLLATSFAEAWTKELPPPDWLPVFLNAWKEDSAPDGASVMVLPSVQHQTAAQQVVPGLRAILRRFPGCQYNGGYFAQAAMGYEEGRSEALARLAEEHLLAQPRGSIGELRSLPFYSTKAEEIHTQQERPDALLALLDHLAVAKNSEWRDKHLRPAISAALSERATEVFAAWEVLCACPVEDFSKSAGKLASGTPRPADLAWVLRIAARRQIKATPSLWSAITGLRSAPLSGFYWNRLAIVARLWIEDQHLAHPGGRVRVMRELFQEALGKEFGSETARNAFKTYRNQQGRRWSGWPNGANVFEEDSSWRFVYSTLEQLAESPENYRAILEIARETGLGQVWGVVGWLMRDARAKQHRLHPRWHSLLQENQLIDGLPDELWLLPQDGLVPAWEFAQALGLTSSEEAARWLESRHKQKPSPGTALMLLAARRSANEVPTAEHITSVLTPCLPALKNASAHSRAAFATALRLLQPAIQGDLLRALSPAYRQ